MLSSIMIPTAENFVIKHIYVITYMLVDVTLRSGGTVQHNPFMYVRGIGIS